MSHLMAAKQTLLAQHRQAPLSRMLQAHMPQCAESLDDCVAALVTIIP